MASAAALAVLSWHFMHSPPTNPSDTIVSAQVRARLAGHPHALHLASQLGSPPVVVGGSVLLAVLCLWARRHRAALFAFVGAPAAGAVTEGVLKPLVHREQRANQLLFPSGHTTGAFALALVVLVVLLPREDTPPLSALVRLTIGVAALAAASVVGIAVVALGWHYATDAVGGAATAVVVVGALAAGLDAIATVRTRSRAD